MPIWGRHMARSLRVAQSCISLTCCWVLVIASKVANAAELARSSLVARPVGLLLYVGKAVASNMATGS